MYVKKVTTKMKNVLDHYNLCAKDELNWRNSQFSLRTINQNSISSLNYENDHFGPQTFASYAYERKILHNKLKQIETMDQPNRLLSVWTLKIEW
jgi:hypothetical protein